MYKEVCYCFSEDDSILYYWTAGSKQLQILDLDTLQIVKKVSLLDVNSLFYNQNQQLLIGSSMYDATNLSFLGHIDKETVTYYPPIASVLDKKSNHYV